MKPSPSPSPDGRGNSPRPLGEELEKRKLDTATLIILWEAAVLP